MELTCFKSYDVRGRLGHNFNEDIVRRVGLAYGIYLKPHRVAVGGDARDSSPQLKVALAQGLRSMGVEVLDLGLCGTEEIYFAVASQNLDGGIMVTGSHNPIGDNGLKFVREGARPINGDNGLLEIKRLAEADDWPDKFCDGPPVQSVSFRSQYIKHLLSYLDISKLRPLTIVADAGHGAAGPVMEALSEALISSGAPLKFIPICFRPDGSFPQGIPNPLLPENRARTSEAVLAHQADLGLAWDGDFDRCFFFDERGRFIEGYYLVGLLASTLLKNNPNAAIIHDPRLIWNTIDVVLSAGGRPLECKTGHAFIKEEMRRQKALYGGEMSAHHYFADFAYCDSGMIPWLIIVELLGCEGRPLSDLVAARQAQYPCSGELNYNVVDHQAALARVEEHFRPLNPKISRLDGLSLEFLEWRFNLRGSNTESLLRLNLETRGDAKAVRKRVAEINSLLSPEI